MGDEIIGHAGAIVSSLGKGNAPDKIKALRDAGVVVVNALPQVGIALQQASSNRHALWSSINM